MKPRSIDIKAPTLFLIALIGAVVVGCNNANSESITFKIVFDDSIKITPNMKMLGWIKMKSPGQKYERQLSFQVPTPGATNTNQFKCSQPGIFFSAELNDITYELDEFDKEKTCRAGEIAFKFHEKQYASALRRALSESSNSANFPRGTIFADSQAELKQAIDAQDAVTSLTKSAELYNQILQVGGKAKAEPYRILNLDLAQAALKSTGTLDPGAKGLVFDPSQKKLVLDNNSVASIKIFQAKNNLIANGKLDWQTMQFLGQAVQ